MANPDRLRQLLGPIGVWTFRLDVMTPAESATAVREIEQLGFPSLWIPEVGRTEAMSMAGHLLHHSETLTVANGIARVIDRTANSAAAAHRHLQAASGGRHVLGLGLGGALSNGPKPIDVMIDYVNEVEEAWSAHPGADSGDESPAWCLAAYNSRMVTLAAERTDGVHTYLISPEHTAATRALIGNAPVIAAEMSAVLTTDIDHGRAIGRDHLSRYIGSRSHQRKFRSLGFTESDFAEGGSDRLVDTLVVYGIDAITERIRAHQASGADHVGVQLLGTTSLDEDLAGWALLAEAVL